MIDIITGPKSNFELMARIKMQNKRLPSIKFEGTLENCARCMVFLLKMLINVDFMPNRISVVHEKKVLQYI